MSNRFNNIEDIIKIKPLILFDGVCNLCNNSVQIVIKNDAKNTFVFSTLQNKTVQAYLLKRNPDILNLDTILLITPSKIYTKSSAALTIAKHLKGAYPLLYVFYIVPKPIRDVLYSYIAKNRYKWFGKKESCMLPSAKLKNKFL